MASVGLCACLLVLSCIAVNAAPTVDKRDTSKRVFWVDKKNADLEKEDDKRVFWVDKKDASQDDIDKRVFWVDKKAAAADNQKRVFWVDKKNADAAEQDKRVFWVEKKNADAADPNKRVFWVEKKDDDSKAADDKRVFWVEKKDGKDQEKRVFWVEKKDDQADKDKRVFWVDKKEADTADALYDMSKTQAELIIDCYTIKCIEPLKECSSSCNEKDGHQQSCLASCKERHDSCVDNCAKEMN
ncbi:uncharacterized protein LOC102807013 isoform X2 [Saccoglossus kowalevskii]